MFEKQKEWIKDHKNEIIVGAAAIGATTAFFVLKDKKFSGVKAALSLTLRFFDRPDDDCDYVTPGIKEDIYTNISISKPGFTVGDLGKFGEFLKEKIPGLTDDLQIGKLWSSYSVARKEQ